MMNHKNQVITFLTVAVSLVLVLPVSNLLDSVVHRDAQRAPLFETLSQMLSQERLFSTDALQGLLRYQAWQRLGRSLDEGQVVAGKDGFLFLGNDFNAVIDKATGAFPVDRGAVDLWAKGLTALKQWYESQGMPFVMAVAPNKHTIYGQKLPAGLTPANKTVTDHLIAAAAREGVGILDLRPVLKAASRDQLLYYQTDTHWNRRAAGIAYKELIAYINATMDLSLDAASVDLVPGRMGAGDLTRLLKFDRFVGADIEQDPRYRLKPSPACLGELDLASAGERACEPTDRPVAVMKASGQYVSSEQALNQLKVLVLSDSFGNAQTELLARTFSRVWFVHWVYVDPIELAEFARAMQPDLVIYQVVERDLFHSKLVAKLPGR